MKGLLRRILGRMNLAVTKAKALEEKSLAFAKLRFLETMNGKNSQDLLANICESHAQLFQDIFVLNELDFKKGGYFVEFGATNGIDLSNSLMLERRFGWCGILSEPSRYWYPMLVRNRKCHVTDECVWYKSGEMLDFNEVKVPELSTINAFSKVDDHEKARKKGRLYKVRTISLTDLLIRFDAPSDIDYLSIDTEGSEYEILEGHDFSKFNFKVITCEHNYTQNRDKIFRLLNSQGYKRVYEDLSDFDDWYVHST